MKHSIIGGLSIQASPETDKIKQGLDKVIDSVDDSLSVTDFATVVGEYFNEQYGSHNKAKFLAQLNKTLEG